MRRVLIVAYYFPPVGGIGSIRLAGFASHLPQFGSEPTVLAPESTPHRSDPSIRFAESRVVRARSIEPALCCVAVGVPVPRRRPLAPTDPRRRLGPRCARQSSSMAFPDAQISWYSGRRGGRRLVDAEPFDAVFSSSYPVTAT